MKHLFLLFTIAFFAITINAQSYISGSVTDSDNEPMYGANVYFTGTSIGTTVDLDGNFRLFGRSFPTSLTVQYLGYLTQTIAVNQATSDLKIVLSSGSSNLDEVVVVGSRGKARTILTSPVPVDNINASELFTSGQETVDQMINYKVPSYNSSNQTVSDATAHFDPSELRNLGPSRTLVLVNGKRKNQSALVYVNDTPGKGEVGVDMKSIPASSIERVEVLRDGASAQYGSDAIAGVINIVLKERTDGEISVGTGITAEGDGLLYNADVNKGFKVGKGTLNLTGSFYHQDNTNRAGEPGKDDLFGVDATNPWIIDNPDLGMTIGQPEYDKISAAANLNLPYGDNHKFYLNGSFTKRDGKSFALYRTPYWITDDAGLLTETGATYQGFQPTFETGILDGSFSVGTLLDFNGWNTDISFGSGSNSVDYLIGNTINPALLPNSPTEFDAGAYAFGNLLGNVDVSKNLSDELTLSLGAQFMQERFKVTEGQIESYVDGGAQSFPGLQPSNALDEKRQSVGAYAEVGYDLTDETFIGAAARYENYFAFGDDALGNNESVDNVSWKFNARQLINDKNGVIRASVSTGFRAPALHQIYLSNVQTLVSGGTISNQGTFNNVDSRITALGIPQLTPETSFNFGVGMAYKLTKDLNVSLDYYNVTIKDRILFSGEIGSDSDTTTVNAVEQILADNDITSMKFFINALETNTQGIDLVLDHSGFDIGSGKLGLIWASNWNKTTLDADDITVPQTLLNASAEYTDAFFNRKEQSRIVSARPNIKSTLGLNYKVGKFRASLNNTYFGEVTWQHAADELKDQTFGAKVITDLLLGFSATNALNINITVNNLLNVYPDEIDTKGDVVTDLGGRFRYPWEVNQFGFNGMYLKLGANYKFK